MLKKQVELPSVIYVQVTNLYTGDEFESISNF